MLPGGLNLPGIRPVNLLVDRSFTGLCDERFPELKNSSLLRDQPGFSRSFLPEKNLL
jgi:hypothetical protein